MKKNVSIVMAMAFTLSGTLSFAATTQWTETVLAKQKLDGALTECTLGEKNLRAEFFVVNTNSTTGFETKYINLNVAAYSDSEKAEAMRTCRQLLKLAEHKNTVDLLAGFNYEGPGPIVGFVLNGERTVFP